MSAEVRLAAIQKGSPSKVRQREAENAVRSCYRMIYQQSQKFEYHINASSIEAAVEGLGITGLLTYHIAPQLSDGSLKVILRKFKSKTLTVHIMHNAVRYTSAKIERLWI